MNDATMTAEQATAVRVMLRELAWYRWTAVACVAALAYGLFGPGTVDDMIKHLHVGGVITGAVGAISWLWRRKHA